MPSISGNDAAGELLRQCVAGEEWSRDLVVRLAEPDGADALFRILIEGLADRFERRLCDCYTDIFALILERVQPDLRAKELTARYRRIREPRVFRAKPKRVAVLSRVTLGADIGITSVLLDAAHQRFPNAEIWFAGSAKAAELFAGFPWIKHLEVPYVRGAITQRLEAWLRLAALFRDGDWLVIDPDSRLTQLGLLPVIDDTRHLFFESRSYGGATADSLTHLTAQWARETLGVEQARNLIAPMPEQPPFAGRYATVSLGTANNAAKQLTAAFEAELIRELCAEFPHVIVDRGFGPEESERVEKAAAGTSATLREGSFASFASLIASSACYVGYDSSGQHAAAAFGTPLITFFKGFVNDRMFARWQPTGSGPKQVMKIEDSVETGQLKAAVSSFSRL